MVERLVASMVVSMVGAGIVIGLGGCASSGGGAGIVDRSKPAPVRELASYERPVVRSMLREQAFEILEEGVESEFALVRANSIEALRWSPRRAERAVEAGMRDVNPGVRFVSVMMAGELELVSLRGLAETLLDDRDRQVRMGAIRAVAALGGEPDRGPLFEGLSSRDPRVRAQAVFLLGEMGDPSAIPLLLEARRVFRERAGSAVSSEDAILRVQIAEALMKLGDGRVESVIRSALYPASREEIEAAVLAAQVIGELELRGAIGQLVQVLEQVPEGADADADPRRREFLWPMELRLASALSLAKMGELGGVFTADLAFDAEDQMTRSQAAFVYGWAGRAVDLSKLELMLGDPSPLVRVSAAAGVLRALESAGVGSS